MCSACNGVFHYEKTKVVDEKYFIIHCLDCVDAPERQPTQYGGEEKHNVRSVVIEGKKKGIGRGWLVPYLVLIISGYISWSYHAHEKKNYLFSPYYN